MAEVEELEELDEEEVDEDACPLDLCDGSGEISTDESDGEGHIMRGVGSRRCPHLDEEADMDDDS